MDWVEDDVPRRRPRRASTFPARFTEPGQPEPRVEQIGPSYERWPSVNDASRRGLAISDDDDRSECDYPRRYRSSSRGRRVPIVGDGWESARPKIVRINSGIKYREGRHIPSPPFRSGSFAEDENSKSSVVYDDDHRPPRVYLRSSRLHRLRGRYDSYDESEDEWDVNQEAYTFSLPRRSRSPFRQDSTLAGSAEPSIQTETNSELHVSVDGPKLGTELHVYRSKYTGEGSVGGLQSAQLNVIHDQKKGPSPLFRWV